MIDSFTGEFRFLSNFWLVPVRYNCYTYMSSEHAYQAAKMTCQEDHDAVALAATPGIAKREAHKRPKLRDFDLDKVMEMAQILRAKFSDAEMMQRLLATGDRFLVEGNTWGDTFWGVCDGNGRNMLGHLLMERRDRIRNG